MFLLKLKEKFICAWPDRIIEGYIQSISIDPFYVILFTGQQIDYLLSLPTNGEVFLHLDATGRIVAKALNSCNVLCIDNTWLKRIWISTSGRVHFIRPQCVAHYTFFINIHYRY